MNELETRLDFVTDLIESGYEEDSAEVVLAIYRLDECMFRMMARRQAGCA